MVFIETTIFSKLLREYLNVDEYQLLQKHLMLNPKDGKIVVGSGGVRKLCWELSRKGKSGSERRLKLESLRKCHLCILFEKS